MGFAPEACPTIYPTATPRTTGKSGVKLQVSSTVITMPVIGARTTQVKKAAMPTMTMRSESEASMPKKFCMKRESNAPVAAPIASMGMNTPQGTPQDIFTTDAINLKIKATASVPASPREKACSTVISVVPPCVPRASIRACPPPIA